MGGNGSVLLYTTIGELIKKYRGQASLSITQLANVAGIHKTVISKIENGDTRRPEWKTLKAIAGVLKIPPHQIVEHYVELEQRPDALLELLLEAIELADMRVVSRVALTFLESPREETYTLLERLYHFAGTVTNAEVKLTLYHLIVKYSRERGVPPYIAKGLLQAYLIERNDLKRLDETFYKGEEILHYINFLTREERVTFYYRMALHAHNSKKYHKCIELGKRGHAEDITRNELRERVALAICNSYYFLGDYKSLEEHLDMYEKLNYKFIIERIKYFRAIILLRRGSYHLSIPLLKECVEEVTEQKRLPRINMLLEALFKINDLDGISKIINSGEPKFLSKENNDPNYFYELGRYYRYKGAFLVKSGFFDEGMEAFVDSILHFGKISDYKNMLQCLDYMYTFHDKNGKMMKKELLRKVKEVYNTINKDNEMRDKG
jgi:transcriptional regulator with XRE-family HTH domain